MHFTKEILWLLLFCSIDCYGNSSGKNITSNEFQIIVNPDGESKKTKNKENSFPIYPFTDPPKIAFLADVHLQDVYADLENSDFKGVLNPVNGKYATIRTMEAQLNSTRLFNENYFAFHTALDDLLNRGIKYVVLPGDFTDDGQPMNVRALRRILKDYEDIHGMRFLLPPEITIPYSHLPFTEEKRTLWGQMVVHNHWQAQKMSTKREVGTNFR